MLTVTSYNHSKEKTQIWGVVQFVLHNFSASRHFGSLIMSLHIRNIPKVTNGATAQNSMSNTPNAEQWHNTFCGLVQCTSASKQIGVGNPISL
jgi:hypothetical protein